MSPVDLIHRLHEARTDFWAHTRVDRLLEAINAIMALQLERDNLEAVLRSKPTGTAAQRERELEKRHTATLAAKDTALAEMDMACEGKDMAAKAYHRNWREAEVTLAEMRVELERITKENERIRAALAKSDRPCAYCSLPAEEWSKCQHGFPGCGRADDAMGCPELGASLRATAAEAELARARKALEERCHDAFVDGYSSADGHGTAPWGVSETKAGLDRDVASRSLGPLVDEEAGR